MQKNLEVGQVAEVKWQIPERYNLDKIRECWDRECKNKTDTPVPKTIHGELYRKWQGIVTHEPDTRSLFEYQSMVLTALEYFVPRHGFVSNAKDGPSIEFHAYHAVAYCAVYNKAMHPLCLVMDQCIRFRLFYHQLIRDFDLTDIALLESHFTGPTDCPYLTNYTEGYRCKRCLPKVDTVGLTKSMAARIIHLEALNKIGDELQTMVARLENCLPDAFQPTRVISLSKFSLYNSANIVLPWYVVYGCTRQEWTQRMSDFVSSCRAKNNVRKNCIQLQSAPIIVERPAWSMHSEYCSLTVTKQTTDDTPPVATGKSVDVNTSEWTQKQQQPKSEIKTNSDSPKAIGIRLQADNIFKIRNQVRKQLILPKCSATSPLCLSSDLNQMCSWFVLQLIRTQLRYVAMAKIRFFDEWANSPFAGAKEIFICNDQICEYASGIIFHDFVWCTTHEGDHDKLTCTDVCLNHLSLTSSDSPEFMTRTQRSQTIKQLREKYTHAAGECLKSYNNDRTKSDEYHSTVVTNLVKTSMESLRQRYPGDLLPI